MQREFLRVGLPELPPYMMDLPLDKRGFPVPWFTPKVNGEWNFQAVPVGKATEAMQKHICWVCGKKLFRNLAFVLGPMCAITRVSSEPASHVECAEFAAKACPFLTKPRMRRAPMPEEASPAAGHMIMRNPGVCIVWVTRKYRPFKVNNGLLIEVGDPIRTSAYSEGREATNEEILESIKSGLPELLKLCKGSADLQELILQMGRAWKDLKLPEGVDLGKLDDLPAGVTA